MTRLAFLMDARAAALLTLAGYRIDHPKGGHR